MLAARRALIGWNRIGRGGSDCRRAVSSRWAVRRAASVKPFSTSRFTQQQYAIIYDIVHACTH